MSRFSRLCSVCRFITSPCKPVSSVAWAGSQVVAELHCVSMQVVQFCRMLEHIPASVLLLFVRHMLAAADQQRSKLLGEFVGRRQLLEQQLEQNKRSLQPSMLHPNRWAWSVGCANACVQPGTAMT